MELKSLGKLAMGRLRWAAHWRCAEPIVVFESDDWGMQRGGDLNDFSKFGKPSSWASEVTETTTDLNLLFELLESFQDRIGRPPVFTANFITANPNFEAIEENGYSLYVETPISCNQDLVSSWKDGIDRRVFYPQYHGRSHYWVENWMDDLRNDVPGARELCRRKQNGGLALIENANWRYHSEYQNWRNGEIRPPESLEAWISGGLKYFEDAFGFRPQSTIAPHYVLPQSVLQRFDEFGFRFVQGGNYHITRNPLTGSQVFKNHALGTNFDQSVIFLARTVRFEPRPAYAQWGLEYAWNQIQHCFQAGVPAVIDTHRINYAGPWQVEARQALSELLQRLAPYKPHFMTSVELGQAIRNGGSFQDVWSHQTRILPVRDGVLQRNLRKALATSNLL